MSLDQDLRTLKRVSHIKQLSSGYVVTKDGSKMTIRIMGVITFSIAIWVVLLRLVSQSAQSNTHTQITYVGFGLQFLSSSTIPPNILTIRLGTRSAARQYLHI